MARPVMPWLAPTIGICAVLATAYLPPRGIQTAGRADRFSTRLAVPTPARMRAQALAEEWRAAQQSRRLAESRLELAARLRESPRSGLVLVAAESGSAADLLVARVAPRLDSAWRELGLNETKITVALLIDSTAVSGRTEVPAEDASLSYLLPDTANRALCVVRLVENLGWRNAIVRATTRREDDWLHRWLKGVLGPCAFFAAYGTPGKSVRNWLENRSYDLAFYPSWDDSTSVDSRRGADVAQLGNDRGWFWDYLYYQSFTAVACLAGHAAGCREAVLTGAGDERNASLPSIVVNDRRFWRRQRLIGATTYLSRVAREVGRDRFLEFWTSPLPVDSALAHALRQPVGDWTAAWQHRLVGSRARRLRLGPSAPLSSSLLAILLAAVAVAVVALTARNREVG